MGPYFLDPGSAASGGCHRKGSGPRSLDPAFTPPSVSSLRRALHSLPFCLCTTSARGLLWRLLALPTRTSAGTTPHRGRCPDPAEQRWHRAVPQQVQVIDAVRPAGHPGDDPRHLNLGIHPARPGDLHMLLHRHRQARPAGQHHHRYQVDRGSVSGGLATVDVRDFAGDLGIHSDSSTGVLDGQ